MIAKQSEIIQEQEKRLRDFVTIMGALKCSSGKLMVSAGGSLNLVLAQILGMASAKLPLAEAPE